MLPKKYILLHFIFYLRISHAISQTFPQFLVSSLFSLLVSGGHINLCPYMDSSWDLEISQVEISQVETPERSLLQNPAQA